MPPMLGHLPRVLVQWLHPRTFDARLIRLFLCLEKTVVLSGKEGAVASGNGPDPKG